MLDKISILQWLEMDVEAAAARQLYIQIWRSRSKANDPRFFAGNGRDCFGDHGILDATTG